MVNSNAYAAGPLVVSGYNVSGSVRSDGEPMKGVMFLLFSSSVTKEVGDGTASFFGVSGAPLSIEMVLGSFRRNGVQGPHCCFYALLGAAGSRCVNPSTFLSCSLQDIMGCNTSPVDGFRAQDESLVYLCNVISKEDGLFTFLSLPSGKYTVVGTKTLPVWGLSSELEPPLWNLGAKEEGSGMGIGVKDLLDPPGSPAPLWHGSPNSDLWAGSGTPGFSLLVWH